MKGLGQNLPNMEIVFFRFLFGTISLLPFIFALGHRSWKSERLFLHGIRGLLLFVGISLWCYGLKVLPLATAAVLGFTVPLFTLPLAFIFLGERVHWPRWVATIVGFVGVAAILIPTAFNVSWVAFTLVGASLLFAIIDVINKKLVAKESMVTMLFYSALVTTILSACPTYLVWQSPTSHQLCLLVVSGIGSNLVIYLLLKALTSMEASALAPFRYLEFLMSVVFGFLFFQELPSLYILLGTAIIIPTTIFVGFYEVYTDNRHKKGEMATLEPQACYVLSEAEKFYLQYNSTKRMLTNKRPNKGLQKLV